jgi:hypothetical protein
MVEGVAAELEVVALLVDGETAVAIDQNSIVNLLCSPRPGGE